MSLKQALQTIRIPGNQRSAFGVAGVFLICVLAGAWWFDPFFFFLALAGAAFTIFFAFFPMIPIFLFALFYPFIQLEIVVGSINVPVVDTVGVLAILSWGARLGWMLLTDPASVRTLRLPAWTLYALWVGVAFISAVSSAEEAAFTLKYVLRPIGFFYPTFVWFTVNAIRDKRTLVQTLWTMFVVGIAVALYGLYGFAGMDTPNVFDRRAVPLPVFGLDPLGGNHNLLADVMIGVIPIGFYLLLQARHARQQKIIALCIAVLVACTLLTFSRTGWIALVVELCLLVLLQYRAHMARMVRFSVPLILVSIPIILYMVVFSLQETVQSSNQNRLLLNDIALGMFLENPAVGSGPGTFINFVARNRVYIEEFGSPLDAHGFIQKVGGEMGAFGLILYGGLLTSIVWRVWRAYRLQRSTPEWSYLLVSLLLVVVGSIVYQLFQTSYFVAKLWFPLGVALAATYIAPPVKRQA